jgi:glucose-6-phosphate 1-dehydrogenase
MKHTGNTARIAYGHFARFPFRLISGRRLKTATAIARSHFKKKALNVSSDTFSATRSAHP